MYQKNILLSILLIFSVYAFAQDTKSQTGKSRINAPAGMKIMRPATPQTPAEKESPPKYYNSKDHRNKTAAKPTQRVGMKSVASLEQELLALNTKLTYLKQQENTTATKTEIASIEEAIKQKKQHIAYLKTAKK